MTLFFYALGHFLVDFLCALTVLQYADAPILFLLYNFCAFALQMPLGILADEQNASCSFALAGIAFVLLALLPFPVLIRMLLCGFGNALYHVGGGRYSLLAHSGFSSLGIFVAPGAIGIFLGSLLTGSRIVIGFVAMSLLLCGFSLCRNRTALVVPHADTKPNFSVGMLFFVVVIRSAVAMCIRTPWKIGVWAIFAAFATAAGKVLGGVAADRLGWEKSGVLSLISAAVLFLFPAHPLAGLLSLLLFQMSMPITLRKAADILPGYTGFSFGMLTFALFLGYLPAYFGISFSVLGCAGLSALSALALLLYGEGMR